MSATAADWRWVQAMLDGAMQNPVFARNYAEQLARVRAAIEASIVEIERQVWVLRPVKSGWEIGAEGRTKVYGRVPGGLPAVHAVFTSSGPLNARSLRKGSNPSNALRNAIARTSPWLTDIGCGPLAAVVDRVSVARSGAVIFIPERNGPRILCSQCIQRGT